MPELTPEKLAQSAKGLGLKTCFVGNSRGRELSAKLLNEFRATVGSVDTVSNPTEATKNAAVATVHIPSPTVGADAFSRQLSTVADTGPTVASMSDIIASLGCTSVLPVMAVPPAVSENFEAAMRSFNTR